jgi:hypothetical protein
MKAENLRDLQAPIKERYRRNAWWYQQQGTDTTELVFREAMQWLERPHEKVFLWMDSFDPHEPWRAPQRFLDQYPLDPKGDAVFWPHSGKADRYSVADLANIANEAAIFAGRRDVDSVSAPGNLEFIDVGIGDALARQENAGIVSATGRVNGEGIHARGCVGEGYGIGRKTLPRLDAGDVQETRRGSRPDLHGLASRNQHGRRIPGGDRRTTRRTRQQGGD